MTTPTSDAAVVDGPVGAPAPDDPYAPRQVSFDEMREQLGKFEGFAAVPLHRRYEPEFRKNDRGTLCLYLQDPGNPDPEAPKNEYLVTPEMWAAITKDLGAGSGYFGKTPPSLLLPQLNWWYGSVEADKPEVHLFTHLAESGNRFAVDIMPGGRAHRAVRPVQMLEVVRDAMTNGVPPTFTASGQNSLQTVTLVTTMPSIEYEVQRTRQRGDIVRGGAMVRFSPVGASPVEVSSYIERLICTNGMTSTDQLDVWTHPGGEGSADPYEWIPTALRRVRDSYDAHFESIQRSADAGIDEAEVPTIIDDLFAHYRLPVALRSAVARRLAGVNIENMWDLTNAITWAATHDRQLRDPRARARLMRVGGDAMTHVERCQECHHLLN